MLAVTIAVCISLLGSPVLNFMLPLRSALTALVDYHGAQPKCILWYRINLLIFTQIKVPRLSQESPPLLMIVPKRLQGTR